MSDTNSEPQSTPPTEPSPPEAFSNVIKDFISDICTTFPEYKPIISKWWTNSGDPKEIKYVFEHCLRIYSSNFMEIINKNDDIFVHGDTEFLPGIAFRQLWSCDISDTTRETIWKYMQLILFSVIGHVHETSDLGDTAEMLEKINSSDLQDKLQEAFENMKQMLNVDDNNESSESSTSANNFPNPKDIHEHLDKMMKGKLGKLAMEFAEETAEELNLGEGNISGTDILKEFTKDPTKLMGMVKKVGGKLDEKIKSGELTESELIAEGMDLMNSMKNMPGMGNMAELFGKMGMPGMGKGAKINTNAMENHMHKNLKMAQMKERMKKKAMARAAEKAKMAQPATNTQNAPRLSEEELITLFNESSSSNTNTSASAPSKNKKKNKNKK